MPIELATCRSCGSDNLEVIEASGLIGADAIIGLGYNGVAVGDQFYCHECGVIADGCALQDAGHPDTDLDAVDALLAKNERALLPLWQILLKHMRGERSITSQQVEADRRIADREQWKGLSW